MRAAAINLRALPEQRDLIDHAANLLGKNRSDFMLEAACERAQSVVLDQVHFTLDADKARLEGAPGFDKDNWPNMADSTWQQGIHAYYGTTPYADAPLH